MKLREIPFEETTKISRDYATVAIKTLDTLHSQKTPLRFIYMSGHFAPRTQAEVPKELKNHGLINYGLLRVCRRKRSFWVFPSLSNCDYIVNHLYTNQAGFMAR